MVFWFYLYTNNATLNYEQLLDNSNMKRTCKYMFPLLQMPLDYYRYISLTNFPTGLSTFCASTIFMIKSKRNGPFWKFWSFYFKHCTNCQIFAAKKRKKMMLQKQLTFKIDEDPLIFNNFWVNSSCLKWLEKMLICCNWYYP